jgi:hypothetical protein
MSASNPGRILADASDRVEFLLGLSSVIALLKTRPEVAAEAEAEVTVDGESLSYFLERITEAEREKVPPDGLDREEHPRREGYRQAHRDDPREGSRVLARTLPRRRRQGARPPLRAEGRRSEVARRADRVARHRHPRCAEDGEDDRGGLVRHLARGLRHPPPLDCPPGPRAFSRSRPSSAACSCPWSGRRT